MATKIPSMTSSEFAKAAGVSAASISKLIRDGKLKAKKESGKWMIPQNQLDSSVVRRLKGPAPTAKSKPAHGRQVPRAVAAPIRPPSISAAPVAPKPSTVTEAPAPAAPRVPETRAEEKTYTIPEFAAMTYLTEMGVTEWLKAGRIKGIQKENGEWRVLEANLHVADISRLLRK